QDESFLMSGPGYSITVSCSTNPSLNVINNESTTLNQAKTYYASNIGQVIFTFFPIPPNGSLNGVFHNTQGTFFLGRDDGSTAVINAMEHDDGDGNCNFWAAAGNKQ